MTYMTTNQISRKIGFTKTDLDLLNNLSGMDLTQLDGITAGTATASKALVLGSSKEIATITSATITTATIPNMAGDVTFADGTTDVDIASHDGTNGLKLGGTLVTSTAAELNILDGATYTVAESNRALDLSARLVAITATGAVTEALHEGRDMYITGTAANTQTLPEATGSGGRYRYIFGEVNTNDTVFVVADTTNTNFIGNILTQDADLVGTIATLTQLSPANSDTMTFDGTTTGGQLGDWIELVDVATDVWYVTGITSVPAGSNTASPFSAAV